MIQPRLIRLIDAPKYLGMDKDLFNSVVRPYIKNIRVGARGVAFDRLDLDKFADEYKEANLVKPINGGKYHGTIPKLKAPTRS